MNDFFMPFCARGVDLKMHDCHGSYSQNKANYSAHFHLLL